MDKKGVLKLGIKIFLILIFIILILQVQSITSSRELKNSQLLAVTSKGVFFGGGAKIPTIQGVNKTNIGKNRYASPNNLAPIVTLIGPLDDSIDDDGEIGFVFSVQDDSLLRDCILYHNINGEWLPDEKNKNTFVQLNYPLHFTIKDVSNGDYSWNILCADDAFNTNSNNNFSFTVNKIPPQVSTITDQILKEDGILTINLNNYFSDSKGDNLSYSVQLINNLKISIDNKTGIATIEPEKNLVGERTIIFTAFDEHGSSVDSNPVKISISEEGDTAPRFISTLTKDGEVDTDGYVFFECNVTDDEGLKEISLYSDTSGTWKLEETKKVSGLDELVTFNITDLPEGNYEWACSAKDNKGQESWRERQNVEVEISIIIGHNIFNEVVNNVNYPAFVWIEYSGYLNNSLTLGYFIVEGVNNGEIYFNIDMSNQSKIITDNRIKYYKKIIISHDELFNNDFVSGKVINLKITAEYTYKGQRRTKSDDLTIKIKEGGWIL